MQTPPKRRKIILTSLLIDRSGQYEVQPIVLPANAGRITGVLVTANQVGEILTAYMGWVVYGPPGQAPGSVLERWYDAVLYNRPNSQGRLTADTNNPVGFQQVLTDEVALSLLRPAAGQAAYVFFPRVLGAARFIDRMGREVVPVGPPLPVVAEEGGFKNKETWCYELPVGASAYFPPTFIN